MEPLPAMGQEQQAQPQEAPQQAQPEQSGDKPFPSSQAEAMQFSNDILQTLYDDKTHENIIKQLSSVGENEKTHSVGMIAANTVGDRVTDVKAQTGRPIEMELAVGAVERVVSELVEMAAGNGMFKMTPEEEQASVKASLDILDGIEGGQQQ